MTAISPDHDAMLFALGVTELETVLATTAFVGAIGVLDRARGGAERRALGVRYQSEDAARPRPCRRAHRRGRVA